MSLFLLIHVSVYTFHYFIITFLSTIQSHFLFFSFFIFFFFFFCVSILFLFFSFFFFFNDTSTTEIYTLSLHDALPISEPLDCVSPWPPLRCGRMVGSMSFLNLVNWSSVNIAFSLSSRSLIIF